MGQRDSLGTLYINERPKHYFCYMYTPCMYMYTGKKTPGGAGTLYDSVFRAEKYLSS